jgi:cell division protein FtsI/penicillin-binding protein 2
VPSPYGGYDSDQTNASFIGWGPADDPQFLVYVWLEKPETSPWGSVVAAPVFRQVVEKLVVLMGIPPDAIRLQLAGR